MNEVPLATFERAILATHGARARLLRTVRVDETFEGEPVWGRSGNVYEFELLDHPSAPK